MIFLLYNVEKYSKKRDNCADTLRTSSNNLGRKEMSCFHTKTEMIKALDLSKRTLYVFRTVGVL